ncbi:monovalent cation:proton antiporter-2 (CPA2) family protein [Polyangium mundeleinium]|uniref:Monovalent cation:proton antiporter-2 (CPA2) family protein n=1 Tax=Polyangium mundeleinium TaxID=2995306 RepID=A0ABT5ESW7_9BACT|nr:monovalent cation:proton antiporter-2 (CPA2) family protein [Polyangium mundeleinium]MDC0744916.1 monovalent cation:proton antiporter-2 (CPA2) family protein [Polyangium mundeleinium]
MLTQSAIFLVAAVVAVALFKRIGLGTVLGYLAAGALIGPSGLGLIHDVDQTLHFAELGVVFLLFLIGLELQPSRLWTMRGTVFGLGGAQVAATTAVITGIGLLLGAPLPAAVVAGVGVSMSSTAFATQILGEKNELGTPHGRSAFGILLFQDVAAIPVLALVPLLGPTPAAKTGSPLTNGLVIVGVIAGLIVAGRFLLRPAFRFIAEARSHELSTATALLVVIGTALVMARVGLSMALGAFIAGVLLADSEYRHELEADIEPFKGLLLGLFFMAVGMSANLRLLKDRPLVVIGLVLALVVVKMTVLYALGRAAKLSGRGAASLGASISQGGEFAFVIFSVARSATVLKPETTELLVVVVTLSMALTPLLFLARDRITAHLAAADRRSFDQIYDEGSSVIIAGFGRFGQIVGRVLRLKRIAFTALDASPTHVDFVRRYGNQIYYGDASRVDLLRAAGAERARLIVLAIDDMDASMRTLHVVQSHFPNLTIVARARNRQHAYALLDAGVTNIIRETFAGSLDAARITLEALGLPSDNAREAVRRFGEYDEAQVRRAFVLRHDEKALVESAKQYGAELERIFEEDAAHRN